MEDIVVAFVRRAHGLTGELQLLGQTDHPDEVFTEGREFGVRSERAGLPRKLTLVESRPHAKAILARFEEIADRTLAERFSGAHLTVPRSELPELAEGEFFVHELVGFEVLLADGSVVGPVSRVYDAAGTTMLGVDGPNGERLIPFTRQIVREVDAEARRMVAEPPPGLLE